MLNKYTRYSYIYALSTLNLHNNKLIWYYKTLNYFFGGFTFEKGRK